MAPNQILVPSAATSSRTDGRLCGRDEQEPEELLLDPQLDVDTWPQVQRQQHTLELAENNGVTTLRFT